MSAPKRRPWPTTPKMPRLVDGQLTTDALHQAIDVLAADGPAMPMTLAEVVDWLTRHVQPSHPPSPSTPPGTRGVRRRRRQFPAGLPGRKRATTEARIAA